MNLIAILLAFFKERFNLDKNKEEFEDVIHAITRNVYFRGANLWVLIFAIFIASIGLNMNSAAVIIGAMLISPLMGPIMGIGLGVGIYDTKLIRISFTNYLVALVIGLVTSTAYFLLTPLNDAHSELLARTTPTVFDVLIALFGGGAGIIATTSKEKGNVIPGVAIATALMPPLCTAGYGLAVGNLYYFVGALYLFFINSVFIGFATLIMVRFLRFPVHQFPNPAMARNVRLWIMTIVFLTFVPSVYIAFNMVKRNVFESNATRFINKELTFGNNIIIEKKIDAAKRTISVVYVGRGIRLQEIDSAKTKLNYYHLGNTELIIKEGMKEATPIDVSVIKSEIVKELFVKSQAQVITKDQQIADLQKELNKYQSTDFSLKLLRETEALDPEIRELSVTPSLLVNAVNNKPDTVYLVYLKFRKPPTWERRKQLENWLRTRLSTTHIKLIVER